MKLEINANKIHQMINADTATVHGATTAEDHPATSPTSNEAVEAEPIATGASPPAALFGESKLATVADVFLSHNSRDKPTVRQLAELLQGRGVNVWLDEWELVPGQPWQSALEDVIKTVKSAVVAIGSSGIGPWEEPEMRACLDQVVQRRLPVIPVLLPGASHRPELPLLLQGVTWVDLRAGFNTVGLDRLVWGITGVNPRSRMESPGGE